MTQPADSRPATVLIAEDSIIQAAMLKRTLSAAGYRVLVAKDGAEALREAEGESPSILITDVVMPEMDGFELCRSLRAQPETAELPILLLTTLSSPEDILEGLAAGADDYLVKPYQEQAILDKVAAMLGTINSEDRAFSGLDEIPFAYHGRDYTIPFRPQTTLRLLMSTYEHAIEQNKALVAAREEITLINRELERKVAERTAELAAANQRLEQSLRELYSTEEQLMQSEKLSAIGEMVGGIVHEINNPVMGAINYVQYAIGQSSDEQLTDFLRKAEERIRQVSKLVEAMLGYVHHGDQRLESVDLMTAVDATIALMGPELKTHGVELSLQLPDSLPPVSATDVGIQQVCANLIKNAVDAMADSSSKRITISAAPSAGWVSLTIEDSGTGISGELRDKVFQPFFTTKPRGKGTGLGLAICQRIMRANGGEILYEPREGPPGQPAGARFVIRFLRSEPDTSQQLSADTLDV
jgi:C4-dicarboxylate-specific signal transduction histidine kinase